MTSRSPVGRRFALRGAFAALLALLVAAVVDAEPRFEPTVPVRAQPPKDKKEPDKKEPTKPPEIKWPTDINGKDIAAVMKDMEDTDPVIREFAARTLPAFGPPAQKGKVSKLLIKRMTAEKDPGVRIAVYNTVGQISFDDNADNVEALRLLSEAVDKGLPGGISRVSAVQTIAMFGPKGQGAITALTGLAMSDPAYETRRSIANTLGRIGMHEESGPNMKALTALADVLAKDVSASVRMEALQSLMLLGPPWAEVKKPNGPPPPVNQKAAAVIVAFMKARVGDPTAKRPALEKDKQVEIWARLVLMRFDPKEVNEENLDAFARFLTSTEVGVKVQALQAIAILGELAGKKLNDVVRVFEDGTAPQQLTIASITTLMAMGAGAKPALPNLKKMLADKKKPFDEKMAEIKKLEAAQKPIEPQLAGEVIALDNLIKTLEAAIKHIENAKPMSPAVDPPKKP
jgi:HEAT repeat protein